MALAAITGFAQPQPETGDIVYVYQKDGDIHAFLRSEITEFYYGFEDENGVTQNEPVMQWIVMEDSICKIPLANIDSISFVTPTTEYQPDAIRIEQRLMDYVVSSDSLTIVFAANTPSNLLPKVGDKLVTAEMNDKLPFGFVGKVKKVTGTTVECETINLTDVFKRLYYTTVTDVNSDSPASVRRRANNKPFEKSINLPEWNKDFTVDVALKVFPIDDLALKGTIESKFNIKPTLTVKSSTIIDGLNTTIDLALRGDFDLTETVGLYGGIELKPDLASPTGFPICPVAPGAYLYWNVGAYLQFGVTASIKKIAKQHVYVERSFHASLKNLVRDNTVARITSATEEFEGCLDGTIGVGAFVELGVTGLSSKLDKICVRGELGLEMNGNIVLYNKDIAEAQKVNKVYEALKASEITGSVVLNSEGTAEVPYLSVTRHLPLQHTWPVRKWNLVPTFEDVEFTQCYSPRTSADVGMVMRGNLYKPEKVGFQIVDEDGNEIVKTFATDSYQKGGRHWVTRVDGLEDDGDYLISPVVKFLGFDLLAYPTMHIDKNPFPVRIVNFEQTGSKYSKQKGFEYDGRNYFYKFNARTTVELSEDAKNVKDWGYVYHDFYDEHKKISCANLGGRIYPDVRYAYYYNEPYRTVELYPYVQYEGETEIEIGKTKIFEVKRDYSTVLSCPDDNHPHAIDLGLPSGTKWACCNVGGDSPGDKGNTYCWGETSEPGKKYTLWDPDTHMGKYIGRDIAGTQYDAAHVHWGSAWQMPTVSQFNELKDNCEYAIAEQDEQMGIRFIGPNGSSIFLPAKGYDETYYDQPITIIWDDKDYSKHPCNYHIGLKSTYYWTSIQALSSEIEADGLGIVTPEKAPSIAFDFGLSYSMYKDTSTGDIALEKKEIKTSYWSRASDYYIRPVMKKQ